MTTRVVLTVPSDSTCRPVMNDDEAQEISVAPNREYRYHKADWNMFDHAADLLRKKADEGKQDRQEDETVKYAEDDQGREDQEEISERREKEISIGDRRRSQTRMSGMKLGSKVDSLLLDLCKEMFIKSISLLIKLKQQILTK